MTLAISPLFAVPFAQDQLDDCVPVNAALRKLFLEREALGARHANPHPSLKQQPGVFESEFEVFAWPDAAVQALRGFCWQALGRTIQQLNGYTAEQMQRLQIFSHTWYHVTRSGGFTILHTHPMASWSGVYCVAPGTHAADRPESGVLRFHNPHFYSNLFMDAGNTRFVEPFHHGSWSIPLKAGQLVLFPSWVQHEVLPYYGTDERITVAFNCWFGMRDAA